MRLPTFADKYDEVQRRVLQDFRLDLMGPHGLPHWSRVLRNGMLVTASDNKVDPEIMQLFALLHDSMREDEWTDIEHGIRAARYVQQLADDGLMPYIYGERLTTLRAAIAGHPLGHVSRRDDWQSRTIQGCWDADRLDLGRVGVKPSIEKLGSLYVTGNPEVIELHWDEAWNVEGMEAMIEAG